MSGMGTTIGGVSTRADWVELYTKLELGRGCRIAGLDEGLPFNEDEPSPVLLRKAAWLLNTRNVATYAALHNTQAHGCRQRTRALTTRPARMRHQSYHAHSPPLLSVCLNFQPTGSRLPSAHTCFNQLDLPEYESKEQLVERLRVAVNEGNVGFGFG